MSCATAVVGLHALVERKGGKQMFVKALCGEEVWDDSLTWLDGDQLRPRVQYVLSSGSLISIGRWTGQLLLEFPGHARWIHLATDEGESRAHNTVPVNRVTLPNIMSVTWK